MATVRPLAHVFRCQISDRAYDPKDKQNGLLAVAFLQSFKSIGDAACHLGGRDLSPTLHAAILDVWLTGQLFDLLLSGYFNPKLSLYCAMEDLSTGHQLMLYAFNRYQKSIPASLYLRWQVTFQTLFITVKVMHVRDPTVSLYICQLGSQPAENLFSITRTLNHNRNFDVLQLRDRLQAVLDIQDIFLAHPDWCKRHERYATDRLIPLEYAADCIVQSVDLKKVWERGTARATAILEEHPQIGSSAHNVLKSLYQGGATLLKPCGAPLVFDKEDVFLGTAPDTKGMEDSNPTDACSLESWLRCHGSDRNRAYVPCANGHTVHITQMRFAISKPQFGLCWYGCECFLLCLSL